MELPPIVSASTEAMTLRRVDADTEVTGIKGLSLHGSNDLEAGTKGDLTMKCHVVSASTEAMTLRRRHPRGGQVSAHLSLSLHGSNDLEAD